MPNVESIGLSKINSSSAKIRVKKDLAFRIEVITRSVPTKVPLTYTYNGKV